MIDGTTLTLQEMMGKIKKELQNFHGCLRQCVIVYLICISPLLADETASNLFEDLKKMVFQIRVVDIASGDKSSIGSGFQITSQGQVATNFHVVSSFVHKPEKYRLESVYHDGSIGELELLGFDVVHDLAIVGLQTPNEKTFQLSHRTLAKGDQIYSMGNPLDLGMTIIEGNYNGLIQQSRYQKILFSGSLNAGMSGGPAFDKSGNVIGINVSKGSEQLSFLVPVKALKALIDNVEKETFSDNYKDRIQSDLLGDQEAFYSMLFQQEWEKDRFVELMLPGQIDPSLKCWGHTQDEKKLRYESVHQHCQSQDDIYIESSLQMGRLNYQYEWIESEGLNRFQLYNFLESRFEHGSQGNAYKEEDVTNYTCDTDFIEIDERSFRISTCTRAYYEYPELYDSLLMFASVDRNDRGVIVRVDATGISRENAITLFNKYLESVEWVR